MWIALQKNRGSIIVRMELKGVVHLEPLPGDEAKTSPIIEIPAKINAHVRDRLEAVSDADPGLFENVNLTIVRVEPMAVDLEQRQADLLAARSCSETLKKLEYVVVSKVGNLFVIDELPEEVAPWNTVDENVSEPAPAAEVDSIQSHPAVTEKQPATSATTVATSPAKKIMAAEPLPAQDTQVIQASGKETTIIDPPKGGKRKPITLAEAMARDKIAPQPKAKDTRTAADDRLKKHFNRR